MIFSLNEPFYTLNHMFNTILKRLSENSHRIYFERPVKPGYRKKFNLIFLSLRFALKN